MSGRIEGRVGDGVYVIVGPQGVLREIPFAEARRDEKLMAAIKRNKWQDMPEENDNGTL